jgi:DUF1009 family protein
MTLGRQFVIAESLPVAVEAMGGPTTPIGRAEQIMRSLRGGASTLSQRSDHREDCKPSQDMRFDVPVIRVRDDRIMQAAQAGCLAWTGKCAAGWAEDY